MGRSPEAADARDRAVASQVQEKSRCDATARAVVDRLTVSLTSLLHNTWVSSRRHRPGREIAQAESIAYPTRPDQEWSRW